MTLRAGDQVIRKQFSCLECRESDFEKLFVGEMPAELFNCAYCGSGRGKSVQEMYERSLGMRPVPTQVEVVH